MNSPPSSAITTRILTPPTGMGMPQARAHLRKLRKGFGTFCADVVIRRQLDGTLSLMGPARQLTAIAMRLERDEGWSIDPPEQR